MEGELVEQFDFAFYVVDIAQKNGIELPNCDATRSCLAPIAKPTAEPCPEASPAAKHSLESSDYEAEPEFRLVLGSGPCPFPCCSVIQLSAADDSKSNAAVTTSDAPTSTLWLRLQSCILAGGTVAGTKRP